MVLQLLVVQYLLLIYPVLVAARTGYHCLRYSPVQEP